MNITITRNNNSRHLVLIMAGWGMDETPFRSLECSGYDIAVAWDYTDERFCIDLLARYREIVVFAWSMGVMECSRTVLYSGLPVTLAVAINGTVTAVDDKKGIPVSVFEGTLNTLSESSLVKFNRRMCGGADALAAFNAVRPRRTIVSLREELNVLGVRAMEPEPAMLSRWDMAVVGSRDMIFPSINQKEGWKTTPIIEIDEPHMPDFQSLINRMVINKRRVAMRFGRTRASYESKALQQHRVAEKLAGRLVDFAESENGHYDKAVEIGVGNGSLTRLYAGRVPIGNLELWDIAPVDDSIMPAFARGVADDAESRLLELPGCSVDLIVSASTIQWFNSPSNAFLQIKRVLSHGGVAAVSLYTYGTYATLARETGVTINYVTPDRLKALLSGDCDILFFETDSSSEEFESTRQLIDHMRGTGVNGVGNMPPSTLKKLLSDNILRSLEYCSTTIIFRKR